MVLFDGTQRVKNHLSLTHHTPALWHGASIYVFFLMHEYHFSVSCVLLAVCGSQPWRGVPFGSRNEANPSLAHPSENKKQSWGAADEKTKQIAACGASSPTEVSLLSADHVFLSLSLQNLSLSISTYIYQVHLTSYQFVFE